MERRHVDRSLQHVFDAVEQEGKILTSDDSELLYQNDRERTNTVDALTIKDARSAWTRLGKEYARLRTLQDAINSARSHLRKTVGNDGGESNY